MTERILLNALPWLLFFGWHFWRDRFASLNRFGDLFHVFLPPGNWFTWITHRANTYLVCGGIASVQWGLQTGAWFDGWLGGATMGFAFYVVRETHQWIGNVRSGRPYQWAITSHPLWKSERSVGWGWDGLFDVPWEVVLLWVWVA